jgi:subtilisin family serine protease
MERDRKSGGRLARKGLQVEQLEARRYLAADLFQQSVLEGREYAENELLVQYAPPVFGPQLRFERPSVSLRVEEFIHTKAMQANGLGVMERVKLAAGDDMQTAMQALRKNPNVLYVEPNYIVRKTAISNDTYYTSGSLWGVYSNDSPTLVGPSNTTNQFGSQAEKAWNESILGSSSVVVGVIDEGVQWNHPDLIDNMWLNPFEVAGDGIDNDGNGYIDDIRGWDFVTGDNSVYDVGQDSHGTHVAGTIGGTGGNASGVVGVNWDVAMISLKFLGTNGGYTSDAVKALDYLTDLKTRHGINIVASNNSWGGGGYSAALHSAIIRSAKKDILFVAAAGNSTSNNDSVASYPSNYSTTVGTSTQTPASYDAVIAVASITSTGGISSFSSYGATTVDIGAPGSGIVSTVPTSTGGFTYANYSGTSMATPHVTGAVALYASTQPSGASAASIKQAILQSATPTASLAGKTVTGGRLNVWDAVQPRSSIQVSSPSPSATTTEAGGTVTFTVVLGAAPTGDVTIPIRSSDTIEGTVSSSSLVFTTADWNVPQTVTVTGVDDSVDDGNTSYSIVLEAAISTDPNYSGVNPTDVALINQDDDTAGITVSAPSGATTTEAGGSVSFTLRLQSQPTENVTIPISSSDTTEGTVSASSLLFTASNWDTEQTVTVTGVDDATFDGNVIYTVVLGAATSTDGLYSGRNPADISLTNIDDDPAPSTKFYVVNDATTDRTYEYSAGGDSIENYVLNSSNTAPRGVASNVAGDRVWVVDNNRRVFVYNNSGALLGSWTAGSLPSNALVEGVTTDGTHVWIVDNRGDRVYYYANAASRLSGTQNATRNFLLNSANRNPRDLVTDGAFLWVVNDASTNVVFRYNLSGVLQNSWSLNSANATPTGITLDPSNDSQDIWVVDSGTDRVYRYANARVSTSPTLTSFFQLAAGNTNPQGIADPPAAEAFGSVEIFVDASDSLNSELGWVAPIVGVGSVGMGSSMLSETRDLVFGPKEMSPERSFGSLIVHRDSSVDARASQQGSDVVQRMGPKLPRAAERLSRGKASLDVEAQLHDLALADLNVYDV